MRRFLLLTALTLGCTGERDTTCVHEGDVSFSTDSVHATETELYVSGLVTWQPCGGHDEADRVFLVDPGTGSTERVASVPAAATPIAEPYEHVFGPGIVSTIERSASAPLAEETLAIGRLVGPGPTPGMSREIRIDVSR